MNTSEFPSDSSPLISIIIPCYNSATTVTDCLDSVLEQTYKNLEVLMIDDCSTDGTKPIVKDYRDQHGNLSIRVLENRQNMGVSYARNKGLENASGQYVAFLDADDKLETDFCEHLLRFANENDLDIICCNGVKTNATTKRPYFPVFDGLKLGTAEELLTDNACHAYFDSSCCKLYRREILCKNAIVFRIGMTFGEDTLFATQAALNCPRIGILGNYMGYQYRISDQSSSSKATVQSRLQNIALLLTELHKSLPKGKDFLLLRKSKEYLWTIRKFGKKERPSLLHELVHSGLWKDILFPVICAYGKWKHKIVVKALQRGYFWMIRLW
jgi:glycosyltransferase involved in cell wall biosynthesis